VSRPRLEAGLRDRLLELPNVRAVANCDVSGFVATEDHTRITGIRLVRRNAGTSEEILPAGLVVDATGRGSRTPAWLVALGYEQPPEECVHIDLGYTSCEYRRTPDRSPGRRGLAIAGEPPHGRAGVLLAQEGDRWHVTVGGYNGEFAPLDPQGFVEFIRGLPSPEIYNVIKDAEPLGKPVPYKFTANLRRRYESVKQFPGGLLVIGDALCSFNPVYAQGMTVAAMEAHLLQECLADGGEALASRFFNTVSTVLDAPWSVAVGNDLRYPHVQSERTRIGVFMNWYIDKLHIAAHSDASLSVAFLRVVNMIAPPPSILHPRIALRVLRGNLRARGSKIAPAPASPAPV
jgi:flavin-dependent dehydrogenase